MKAVYLCVAIGAASLAGLALAEEAATGHRHALGTDMPLFRSIDADANGSISLEEFLAAPRGRALTQSPDADREHLSLRFQHLDSNGDGTLSPDELLGGARRRVSETR